MKLRFTLNFIIFIVVYLNNMPRIQAQVYAIGHIQESIIDVSRGGRNIGLEIYYPGVSGGDNVEVASGQFPVLVFGHGFLMTWSAYQPIWEALVPEGYIMVFPTTEGTFSPSHGAFGADISRIRAWLIEENGILGSRWEGHILPKSAAMGHSMGGGAAFLAMQADTNFSVLVGIAAAETNPSAVQAAAGISRPVLILAGQNDCVTPIAQHQQPMYDGLGSASRCLITINGGSHCQFAAPNFFCNTGESSCQPAPGITAQVQQTLSLQAMIPWLDFYLKDKCPSGPLFQQYVSSTAGMSVQQTGILNCTTTRRLEGDALPEIALYPNPSNGILTIHVPTDDFYTVEIWDVAGHKMHSFSMEGSVSIHHSDVPTGLYWLRVLHASGVVLVERWNVIR